MRTILIALSLAALAAGAALAQSATPKPAGDAFPGCEWRPALERGAEGRSALFCRGRHGNWRRIIVDGLSPQTADLAKAGDVHAMAVLGYAYAIPLGRERGEEG